jgi:hypothetical protein
MKRFGIIVFSALLLYAGVAWALDECFAHESHADHLASKTQQDLESSAAAFNAGEDCLPLILCPLLAEEVGTPTITARATLPRASESASFLPCDSIPPSSNGFSGPVSLSRLLAFSFYAGVPHHLFLSVLHI